MNLQQREYITSVIYKNYEDVCGMPVLNDLIACAKLIFCIFKYSLNASCFIIIIIIY